VKKVKKKTVISVVLTAMVMLVGMFAMISVVKADNKVSATATITGINYVNPNVQYVVGPSGVMHVSYFEFGGTITLTADSGTPITVNWMDVCTGNYNPTTNRGVWVFNEVWTLQGGTFVGMDHPRTVGDLLVSFGVPTGNPTSTSIEGHIILHGTGAYDGQALEMTLTPQTYPTFVGTWLKS
jgi:hypothetical protein